MTPAVAVVVVAVVGRPPAAPGLCCSWPPVSPCRRPLWCHWRRECVHWPSDGVSGGRTWSAAVASPAHECPASNDSFFCLCAFVCSGVPGYVPQMLTMLLQAFVGDSDSVQCDCSDLRSSPPPPLPPPLPLQLKTALHCCNSCLCW